MKMNNNFFRFVLVHILIANIGSFVFAQSNLTTDTTNFNFDKLSDLGIFRRSTGLWAILPSSTGAEPPAFMQQLGISNDWPIAGDYDNDGRADLAVVRSGLPSLPLQWYLCLSSLAFNCNQVQNFGFGLPGDIPLRADLDADGKLDYGVYRPSSGSWYFSSLGSGAVSTKTWGVSGDLPVPADFDGDGKDDFAIWRPSIGYWAILQSSKGFSTALKDIIWKQWGIPGDMPIPSDRDRDGRADLVVWRPSNGTWYSCLSSTGYDCSKGIGVQFGLPGDYAVDVDFDGDLVGDYAVWRPSNGTWYYTLSKTGEFKSRQWGLNGDVPIGVTVGNFTFSPPPALPPPVTISTPPIVAVTGKPGSLTNPLTFGKAYRYSDGLSLQVIWRAPDPLRLTSSRPSFGNQFVVVGIRAINSSRKIRDFYPELYVLGASIDGRAYDDTYARSIPNSCKEISNTLIPGGSVECNLVYEVPIVHGPSLRVFFTDWRVKATERQIFFSTTP